MTGAGIWLGVSSLACAAAPFSFDAAPGRLPKNVVPIDYTIALVPDLEARTVSGTETVTVRVRAATDTVVFNSLNEKLTDVRLDGTPARRVVSDDGQQLTTVTLAHAAATRMGLIVTLAERHPALSWSTFSANADVLLAPNPKYAPLITAEYVPEYFWESAAPDKVEAWVRARVPAEMSVNVDRGMEAARARQVEKTLLVPAADACVGAASRGSPAGE